MPDHDIIVIGASAGGVEALSHVARGLPADLPAAVFVVLHISAQTPSILPTILARAGPLPAAHAADGEPLLPGRIYVAPPDQHLLVAPGLVRVVRGPRENRYRPAVDPLFRSAALAYGPRVVGVVLTGALDDGTAGMRWVRERGGVAVVQEPDDALYPSMPASVLRHVGADHRLPLADIPPLLARLAREPAKEGEYPVSDELRTEAEIAEQKMEPSGLLDAVERLGELSSLTCPECHGALWEQRGGDPLRFRCHVGHVYSADALAVDQSQGLEQALWSAQRALEEKMVLMRKMADRSRERRLARAADVFDVRAREAERHAEVIRQILLSGREHSEAEPAGVAEGAD